MMLSFISCLLSLGALVLAPLVNSSQLPLSEPCCKKGYFCCGDKCQPSWKASFLHCPRGSGCCQPNDPCKENPFQSDICKAEEALTLAAPRYTFNQKSQQCDLFFFGGCGGNGNNFEKEADCIKKCDAKPPADCCEPGEKCCGDACIPDDAQTFAPCGEPTCCKPTNRALLEAHKPCICTLEFASVCYLPENKEFGNKCFAACEGFAEDKLTKGPCPKGHPKPDGCCPQDRPVCCGDSCITKEQSYKALCTTPHLCGCPKPDPPSLPKDCICLAIIRPVCSLSTGKDYNNDCEAACAKDPGPFIDGLCGKTAKRRSLKGRVDCCARDLPCCATTLPPPPEA